MIKILTALTLTLTINCTEATAQPSELCRPVANAAWSMMIMRQGGMTLHDAMASGEKMEGQNERDLWAAMTNAAWKRPVYSTQNEKYEAAFEFSEEIFNECLTW